MISTPMADYRYIIKPQWAGYHMANTDRWYFAYTIDGDTITVVDARHAQNMHEDIEEI